MSRHWSLTLGRYALSALSIRETVPSIARRVRGLE